LTGRKSLGSLSAADYENKSGANDILYVFVRTKLEPVSFTNELPQTIISPPFPLFYAERRRKKRVALTFGRKKNYFPSNHL